MIPKIFIEGDPLYYNKIKWVMTIISQYSKIPYSFVSEVSQSNISIGSGVDYNISIDNTFFLKIKNGQTTWKQILPDGPVYKNEQDDECLLETIFYLVNCIQEINLDKVDLDHYGRFKYTSSLQHHYGIIETNFVGHLIDRLIEKYPILNSGMGMPKHPSQVFLSHDIDLLHSGWKVEAYLALQRSDWKRLFKVLKDFILCKPFYNNIQQVLDIDQTQGFKSCFYWLPAFGKDKNGIMNADYSLNDLVEMSTKVAEKGFSNGIHKSTFPTSFSQEMSKFNFKPEHNRYHFLKFQTHKAWKEIELAGLKTDASLGFAEHIGFRNSYGLPFVPFDMANDRPFSFVVIPLHVMDVTLYKYMNLMPDEISNKVEKFLEQNLQNSLISILWHNNTMTDFNMPLLNIYSVTLLRCNENKLVSVLSKEIYDKFSLRDKKLDESAFH